METRSALVTSLMGCAVLFLAIYWSVSSREKLQDLGQDDDCEDGEQFDILSIQEVRSGIVDLLEIGVV